MTTIHSAETRLTRIGYWHSSEQFAAALPHPQSLVSPEWEPQRRGQIVEYLRAGHGVRANGLSFCIFGCCSVAWQGTDDPTEGVRKPEFDEEFRRATWVLDWGLPTGCVDLSDGVWLWPEGLAHYVEAHGIRLPDEFVAYAAARDFRCPELEPESNGEFIEQHEFWMDWCRKNARFEYEPNCSECRKAAQR